jgi:hypothetical protein
MSMKRVSEGRKNVSSEGRLKQKVAGQPVSQPVNHNTPLACSFEAITHEHTHSAALLLWRSKPRVFIFYKSVKLETE